MELQSAKLVYFSPTGTTKRVVQGIAQGLAAETVEHIDITTPVGRSRQLRVLERELLVVAVPVYMGRVPALILDWLNGMQVLNAPTVCVAVYGNRVYDDALLELKHIVSGCGGIPVAGAAFVGEHSFSSSDMPVAHGRPDVADMAYAVEFGQKLREKLQSLSAIGPDTDVEIPGEHPYRGSNVLWSVDFMAVSDACVQCGECADVCPAGAISADGIAAVDTEACITCCACIKHCPQQARSVKDSPVMEARKRLNSLFSEPKQVEMFL